MAAAKRARKTVVGSMHAAVLVEDTIPVAGQTKEPMANVALLVLRGVEAAVAPHCLVVVAELCKQKVPEGLAWAMSWPLQMPLCFQSSSSQHEDYLSMLPPCPGCVGCV